jgi:hypothetical protein
MSRGVRDQTRCVNGIDGVVMEFYRILKQHLPRKTSYVCVCQKNTSTPNTVISSPPTSDLVHSRSHFSSIASILSQRRLLGYIPLE